MDFKARMLSGSQAHALTFESRHNLLRVTVVLGCGWWGRGKGAGARPLGVQQGPEEQRPCVVGPHCPKRSCMGTVGVKNLAGGWVEVFASQGHNIPPQGL